MRVKSAHISLYFSSRRCTGFGTVARTQSGAPTWDNNIGVTQQHPGAIRPARASELPSPGSAPTLSTVLTLISSRKGGNHVHQVQSGATTAATLTPPMRTCAAPEQLVSASRLSHASSGGNYKAMFSRLSVSFPRSVPQAAYSGQLRRSRTEITAP